MLTAIAKMIDQAGFQYLSPDDLIVLGAYSRQFVNRSRLYQKTRDLEDQLVEEVLGRGGNAVRTGERDVRLMVRYCAMAMLLDDDAFLEERYLAWLRTTAPARGGSPLFRYFARTLTEVLTRRLSTAEGRLLSPWVEMVEQALA